MISHKNHRRNSAKAAARSAPELTSAGAETLFHNLFPFAQPIVENTSGETGAPFSTVWKVHCRPVGADFHKAVQIVFHFAESYAAAVNAFQTEKQAEHPGEG